MYYTPMENEEVKVGDIYPVTIMRARYGGCYEGGTWLAFNCDPNDVPTAVWDSDVPCMIFFDDEEKQTVKQKRKNPLRIGRGSNPLDALKDLAERFHVDQRDGSLYRN